MVKPEKFDHLDLVYNFRVPLKMYFIEKMLQFTTTFS